MQIAKIYDIIGIGPFNLGLAALAADIPELECLFIEKNDEFNWHPGMMLPTAKMQVPFYADLVTLANPCSRFSYLAYLKAIGRLFKFAINETYIPYRSEFNAYCQWVVEQLNNLQLGITCTNINYNKRKKIYSITTTDKKGKEQLLHGKHIILGIGTQPSIPACAVGIKHPLIFHSSEYLVRKHAALMNKRITIIGSGQSAAEIFLDLLPHMPNLQSLHWYTRSARFHPMEYAKFTLEMSSPNYINYFYSLDPVTKKDVLSNQQYLFKGINTELINEIYQQLYLMDLYKEVNLPTIRTSCEMTSVKMMDNQSLLLGLKQTETNHQFFDETDVIILATGHNYKIPSFLSSLNKHILWLESGIYNIKNNYSIDQKDTLFVQNADIHTHGFNSADIGLGPYRNAMILNTILKWEYFTLEKTSNVFQQFTF